MAAGDGDLMRIAPAIRDVIVSRPTAPSEGRASPRKPNVWMFNRSEPSIFDVAWRATAIGRSTAPSPRRRLRRGSGSCRRPTIVT